MGGRLAANVVLLGPDGLPASFPEGTPKSEVPDWAQEQMTNPAVWDKEQQEQEDEPKEASDNDDAPKAAAARKRAAAK